MAGLFEALSVPYVFPHESLFVLGIGVVIVGLLIARVRVIHRRRQDAAAPTFFDRTGA